MHNKSRIVTRSVLIILLMAILPISLIFIQESKMLGMNPLEMFLVGMGLFIFSVAIACWLIIDYGKDIQEKKTGKSEENHKPAYRNTTCTKDSNLTKITLALVILGLVAYIASRQKRDRKK